VLKYLVIGVWVCSVSLGSAYGVMSWHAQQQQAAANPQNEKVELETLKTKMVHVPIVDRGALQGYVLVQFTFTMDAKVAEELSIKPDVYVVDEAFRLIYSGEGVNFRTLNNPDVGKLGKLVKDNANKRMGHEVIRDLFVQELNFLPKEQFRSGK
jgi:hypothetical protein